MSNLIFKESITKALINDEIVVYDVSSEDINFFNNIKEELIYLGIGSYHSIDNYIYDNLYTKNIKYHFWKFKNK